MKRTLFLILLLFSTVIYSQDTPATEADPTYIGNSVYDTSNYTDNDAELDAIGEYTNMEPVDNTGDTIVVTPPPHYAHRQIGFNWLGFFSSIAILIAIIWTTVNLIIKSRKDKDFQISPSSFFAHNAKFKIEMIASYSTLTEVLGLAIISCGRGVDIFNAINRYALVGFLELVATFIFMEIGEACTKGLILQPLFKPLKTTDEKPAWTGRVIRAIGGLILSAGILFLAFFPLVFPTLVIYYLYVESIGQLTLVFKLPEHVYDIWSSIVIYSDTTNNTIGMLEMAAILMILMNPILNGLQLIMSFREHVPKYWKKYSESRAGVKTNDPTNTNKTPTFSTSDVLHKLSAITGKTYNYYWETLCATLGRGPEKHSITMDQRVKDKTLTAEKLEEEIINALLGKADSTKNQYLGILGYEHLVKREKALPGEISTLEKDVNSAQSKHDAESDTVKKASFAKQLSEKKKQLDNLNIEQSKLPNLKDETKNKLISLTKTMSIDV